MMTATMPRPPDMGTATAGYGYGGYGYNYGYYGNPAGPMDATIGTTGDIITTVGVMAAMATATTATIITMAAATCRAAARRAYRPAARVRRPHNGPNAPFPTRPGTSNSGIRGRCTAGRLPDPGGMN